MLYSRTIFFDRHSREYRGGYNGNGLVDMGRKKSKIKCNKEIRAFSQAERASSSSSFFFILFFFFLFVFFFGGFAAREYRDALARSARRENSAGVPLKRFNLRAGPDTLLVISILDGFMDLTEEYSTSSYTHYRRYIYLLDIVLLKEYNRQCMIWLGVEKPAETVKKDCMKNKRTIVRYGSCELDLRGSS